MNHEYILNNEKKVTLLKKMRDDKNVIMLLEYKFCTKKLILLT